jgi:hypothetical protein
MTTKQDAKDTTAKTDQTRQAGDQPGAAPHNPWLGFISGFGPGFGPFDPKAFAALDPMAVWTQSQQAFHKMMTDALGRAGTWSDEYAAIEAQLIARANAAVETWAQLAHDTIAYGAQLSAQARKLSAEAMRKASTGA